MPTYEYECSACGHLFEQFQMMTADPIKKCPQCSKLKVKRLFSGGGGIIFKGSGFYETDYKRKKGEPKAPAQCPAAKSNNSNCAQCPKSKGE